MALTIWWVVIDAVDPERLASFYADLLDLERTQTPYLVRGEIGLVPPDADVHRAGARGILILADPREKQAKNRLHLDVVPVDRPGGEPASRAAEVARALSLGATPVDIAQGTDVPWTVLADPEGNEFCVLEPRELPRR